MKPTPPENVDERMLLTLPKNVDEKNVDNTKIC
jgi:hypothetical protein